MKAKFARFASAPLAEFDDGDDGRRHWTVAYPSHAFGFHVLSRSHGY